MADETDFTDAGQRAKGLDVLFHFCGESFTHFKDVALSLVFVTLGQQNNSAWIL